MGYREFREGCRKPIQRKASYKANRAKRNKKFKERLGGHESGLRRYIRDCDELEEQANVRMAEDALRAQEERDAEDAEDLERCVLARYDERC